MSQASLIPEDTSFVGDLEGDGDLTVAGHLEGPVRIRGALVVEPSGEVRGPVHARSVTVRGIVAGDTHADEHIRIEDGGCVVGDVTAPRVHVVEGARLRGQMHMEGDTGAPEPPAESETPPAPEPPAAPEPSHKEDASRGGRPIPSSPPSVSTGAVPSGPEPPRLDPDGTAAASTASEGAATREGPPAEPSGPGKPGKPAGHDGTRESAPPMRMPSWGKRRRAHRRHATETG